MRTLGATWIRGALWGLAAAALSVLTACGGGGGSTDGAGNGTADGGSSGSASTMGTLRVSLTDSPACGYDNVWITVEKVRVHRSGSAGDDDSGWVDIPLPQVQPFTAPPPLRVDLLTLTNGVLVPLGQVQLPAGTYSQLRLVLAANTASDPFANAVTPIGESMVALTTPSAQQSGLKMNVDLTVPAGQEADFAIDFDACKSIVKAGNSGKILLKPVLSVLPMDLQAAGQRIQGWLDPALLAANTSVSVQSAGQVVHATPPVKDSEGNLGFVLYPVPVGTYDLVVTAAGRSAAVVTGVPAHAGTSTTVNSVAFPIVPPVTGLENVTVSGTVTFGASPVDTGGLVRALQVLVGGPTVEIASANAAPDNGYYSMTLPLGVPVKAEYVSGTTPLLFAPDPGTPSEFLLSATVARSSEVKTATINVGNGPVVQDFEFAVAP